ncbi:metal ABC transporter permease [Carnobacteriaceae bacterium zg-ZUI252]|nr:metal ABC transporter permease [Carnobacteriaceae bacterium zg-ZUI252]MBS4770468.1 metal ABC transporter permease [Carnobacteriaceae bacterium zg-ZUI240]QTU82839.1 metal ABC transporter permease [Carnobacteriaceae bacterium zg-C25]
MEVAIILILTALNCHLVGHILVMRNESMIADALSHSILLGIVLGFFTVRQLNSPLLVVFAALFGVLTILLISRLNQSVKINHDTATGLVFPLFFAIAVILITMYANNVHLDMDMVLMGEIIFAPLSRMDVFGIDVSVTLVKVLINFIGVIIFLCVAYQPLKLYLSNPTHAKLSGVNTSVLSISVMLLVAFTTVMSFDSVGSISVIAFFVAPSLCVLHYVKHYGAFLYLSSLVAIIVSLIGYYVASVFDLTVAGTTTTVALVTVLVLPAILKRLKRNG